MKLAERTTKRRVFALHLPQGHRNEHFLANSLLLHRSINKIQKLVTCNNEVFTGVIGIGHSKGAILLAERQFAKHPSAIRIIKTISLAGRLKVSTDDKSCPELLKEKIESIHRKILKKNDRPIVQLIPERDWNAPYDSMAPRPHQDCYKIPGMHLSSLFSDKLAELLIQKI
ncbi:MAG: hypothetical protein H0X46_07280 [Bacteroidetes bacterium]|nr:hypothetical protein [Bacteroidota bacterium]